MTSHFLIACDTGPVCILKELLRPYSNFSGPQGGVPEKSVCGLVDYLPVKLVEKIRKLDFSCQLIQFMKNAIEN